MQQRRFFRIAGIILLPLLVTEARAISEEGIIYIQEDGLTTAAEMVWAMANSLWKDIAAVFGAFLCSVAMLILAIKQRNPGK